MLYSSIIFLHVPVIICLAIYLSGYDLVVNSPFVISGYDSWFSRVISSLITCFAPSSVVPM